MKLSKFIEDIKSKESDIVYLCVIHMLEKVYNIEEEEILLDELKEFFINYVLYDKYLNDYASVIYKQFESSNSEIYESMCNYFDENSDNKYLFEYRLKRVLNQDPTKFLTIKDEDIKKVAIKRVEEKLKIIKESEYYKDNKDLSRNEIEKLTKSVNLAKNVVGIV